MNFKLYKDGSFDILSDRISLIGAYPAVDGIPVRPLKVLVAEDCARYELLNGVLIMRICRSRDMLEITCAVEGLEAAHDIEPLANARIDGCDRVFVQGKGIGGPSGFFSLKEKELTSHAVMAVGTEGEFVALNTRDNTRLNNAYRIEGGTLSAGFDTECVALNSAFLPTLYLRHGTDYSSTLRECAKEIAKTMHARPVTRAAFHWCSWYYLYHNLDQATLEEYLEGFRQYKSIAPFSHIQIDAGYFPSCGDWLEHNDRFPGGLKHAADTILSAGYEPGIWIGPFMVGDNSKLYKEHPDWMLRSADGGYVRPWIRYNEPKPWGYRDSDYFVLDTSHPDAMAYLKKVFSTLREWGFTLFKTDFMLWGLQDSSKVIRHTPGKTSFEYYRDVMLMIREAIGEDARWLGCIAPFMPSVGYMDMMRIGGDVGAQWEESGFGPQNMLRELTADQYFNDVYWQNDPDAVMLRDFHIHLKPEQIEALAILEAMSGGVIYTSDPVHLMGQDRRDLLNFIRPDGLHDAEWPFWGDMREEIVVIQRLKSRTMVFLFNKTNHPITGVYDWKKLLGEDIKFLFRRHGDCRAVEDVPFVVIPPRSGVLLYGTHDKMLVEVDNLWEEEK